MLTKEELLDKGIEENTADEIIAGFSDSTEDNPLLDLKKALGDGSEMDPLLKADKGEKKEDEEEKDDYNEDYMKKNMKRYMKENQKMCAKMMKEMDGYGEDMKKAIDDIDVDLEGAVIQMEDLKPFLDTIGTVVSEMAKALPELAGRIDSIEVQSEKNYDLMQKSAKVHVATAEGIGGFLDQPQGRKAVIGTEKMSKASDGVNFSQEDNKIIYDKLYKATKDGDAEAGQVISAFESKGKNANAMHPVHKKFISDLLQKEAN